MSKQLPKSRYHPVARACGVLWVVGLAMVLGGCSALLPAAKREVGTPWADFAAAKQAFDQITPYQTRLDEVRRLGFDPFKTPNMQVLNHAQVVSAVLPSPLQDPATIARGILDCMKAQEGCVGYAMEPSRVEQKRIGNFLLDFFNFRRDTQTTGWKFAALVVVIRETVVYKQWNGQPQIETTERQTNPLGPLQSIGETTKVLP